MTDGPFAETKECLAGFYMIEARDLNEAIQITSRIPPAQKASPEWLAMAHQYFAYFMPWMMAP